MPYLPADPPPTISDLVRAGRLVGHGRSPAPSSGWFVSGRTAMWAGLEALGIGEGHEVLLPSYLCESVVSPVLTVGARPRFYPVGRDLAPALDGLSRELSSKTKAVVLIHYLGFPGPLRLVRGLCDDRGIAMIEDCAHALYSGDGDVPLGSIGDLAFFSPWKSLPLPDGGSQRLNVPAGRAAPSLPAPSPLTTAARLGYRAIAAIENRLGWSPRPRLLQRNTLRRSFHDRTSGAPVARQRGSDAARAMFLATRSDDVVRARRVNYQRLLAVVDELPWATPIFPSLPPGVCPLALPILAEERDRWRDVLLARGVNVRTYWEHLPHQVDTDRFVDATWLRDRILVLPVHQGLSSKQVEWLARLLPALGR